MFMDNLKQNKKRFNHYITGIIYVRQVSTHAIIIPNQPMLFPGIFMNVKLEVAWHGR